MRVQEQSVRSILRRQRMGAEASSPAFFRFVRDVE